MRSLRWLLGVVTTGLWFGGGVACVPDPEPLPTQEAVAPRDRAQDPPLYQLLYDAPLAPRPSAEASRVRQLVWLRHMELSRSQLQMLSELVAVATDRQARLQAREADIEARYAEVERAVHQALWEQLAAGTPVDAPELGSTVDQLRELRAGGSRERELVTARLAALQAILDAERPFLRSLSPRQEQLMADALFFLRHRLDPIGTPGDFRALVGTTWEPGQYAVLQRGLDDMDRDPLDIGGLWQDDSSGGHALFDARREVLLLLAILEPELPRAIEAAKALAPRPGTAGAAPEPPAPAPQAAPPPADAPPAPGTPEPPPPGDPDAPMPPAPPADGSPPPPPE